MIVAVCDRCKQEAPIASPGLTRYSNNRVQLPEDWRIIEEKDLCANCAKLVMDFIILPSAAGTGKRK